MFLPNAHNHPKPFPLNAEISLTWNKDLHVDTHLHNIYLQSSLYPLFLAMYN